MYVCRSSVRGVYFCFKTGMDILFWAPGGGLLFFCLFTTSYVFPFASSAFSPAFPTASLLASSTLYFT